MEDENRERKEAQGIDGGGMNKDGGSSSNNSIVDESRCCEKGDSAGVRPYVRSKLPRLRWTPDLQLCFLRVVERLGGQQKATPKLVLQMMNIKGLSIAHVKSHLQMYRNKKIDDKGQVINDTRYMLGSSSSHYVPSLRQFPMFPRFDTRPGLNFGSFRHGDQISWGGEGSWNASIAQTMRNKVRSSLCDYPKAQAMATKLGINTREIGNPTYTGQNNKLSCGLREEFLGIYNGNRPHMHTNLFMLSSSSTLHDPKTSENIRDNEQACVDHKKRKASSSGTSLGDGGDVDLNLSLEIRGEMLEEDDHDREGLLSLSLSPPKKKTRPSINPKQTIMKLGGLRGGDSDNHRENPWILASTLDLTI